MAVKDLDVENVSKELLQRAVDGKVTEKDRQVWSENGHLVVHWLREKFKPVYF